MSSEITTPANAQSVSTSGIASPQTAGKHNAAVLQEPVQDEINRGSALIGAVGQAVGIFAGR